MIGRMYLTMSPLLLGGILNMVFTKTKLYKKLAKPIDCGKCCRDGRRIFGDNKTTIGFVSMVVFCILSQLLSGLLCSQLKIEQYNDLFSANNNTFLFNLWFGALTGFIYMFCELPNSFIKRRINIPPGRTVGGIKGFLFFIMDQIDSLLGVMALLCVVAQLGFGHYWQYVFVGALTHIFVNIILFSLKIRRNI